MPKKDEGSMLVNSTFKLSTRTRATIAELAPGYGSQAAAIAVGVELLALVKGQLSAAEQRAKGSDKRSSKGKK